MKNNPQSERTYFAQELSQALNLKNQYSLILSSAQNLRVLINEETYGSNLPAPTSVSPEVLARFRSYYTELQKFTPLFDEECRRLKPLIEDIERLTCSSDFCTPSLS